MFIASQLVQSMNRSGAPAPKPAELQPGQVFKGTVVKLYPDNMALVQIGGMQVQAKLETNLEAGQQAWLQVQPSTGVVTLKVLTTPESPTGAQEATLEGLLRTLGIANTKENRSLVQALLQANLPVGKDWVQAFSAVSKSMGGVDQATIDAFLLAMKRNLPLTPQTVTGLRAFLSDKPLTHAIQQFLQLAESFLQEDLAEPQQPSPKHAEMPPSEPSPHGSAPRPNQEQSVRQLVRQLTEKVAGLPLALPELALDSEQSAQPNTYTEKRPAMTSVPAHLDAPAALPDEAATEQGSIPPGNMTVPETGQPVSGKQVSKQPIVQPDPELAWNEVIEETEESRSQGNRTQAMPQAVEHAERIKSAVRYAAALLPDKKADAQPDAVAKQGQPSSDEVVTPRIHDDQKTSFPGAEPLPTDSKSAVKHAEVLQLGRHNPIQELFRALGLSHEREILGQGFPFAGHDAGRQLESVKSMLLQLSQAPTHAVPAALREAADALLQHVTGQQLMLVQPSAQTISQLVMQIPIRTSQGEETAYVQVESKKRAGGQLDPENCRLFFHLQLQAIGTTMVDVSIVNRIVSIQVYNDTPWVEALAQQMKDGLADQLREAGYQLSGMRVQNIPEPAGKTGSQQPPKTGLLADYKGVDIRI